MAIGYKIPEPSGKILTIVADSKVDMHSRVLSV